MFLSLKGILTWRCRKGRFHRLVREFSIVLLPVMQEKIFLSKNYDRINYSMNILHTGEFYLLESYLKVPKE